MSRKSGVFLMLVLTVLLSSISINVKAQGQDANFHWRGNDISTVIANPNAGSVEKRWGNFLN